MEGLCADNFSFLALSTMSDEPFLRAGFDGILGLARPKIGARSINLVEALYKAGRFAKPTFSLYYARGTDDLSPSKILLGSDDTALFKGSLSHFGVPEDGRSPLGFWRLELQDIQLGSQSLNLCDQKRCFVYFDSGSEFLGASTALANSLMKAIRLDTKCGNLQ